MDRLESAIHRLDLAAEDLSDLAEKRLPDIEEHGSAAFVVREVAQELGQLYHDSAPWTASTTTPRGIRNSWSTYAGSLHSKTNRDRC